MLKYLVVEISGKQYMVSPKQEFLVSFLGDLKKLSCDKVLAKSADNKLEIGYPYLKAGVVFDVLGQVNKKIRVATYKAKSNTRKVIGQKSKFSKIRLAKYLL